MAMGRLYKMWFWFAMKFSLLNHRSRTGALNGWTISSTITPPATILNRWVRRVASRLSLIVLFRNDTKSASIEAGRQVSPISEIRLPSKRLTLIPEYVGICAGISHVARRIRDVWKSRGFRGRLSTTRASYNDIKQHKVFHLPILSYSTAVCQT